MARASSPNSVARVVAASFVGTAIEWYDFFLYGTAAALVFNRLFFPTFDPAAGTMAAFATFAVGFLARPFGGIVFGHFGDRFGRKSALVTTLVLMGVSTFLIGALPTYESAGVLAPVLPGAARFVQGLGVGGEWAGAVLLVVEHSAGARRGFHASWVQAGVPVGLLLANGALGLASLLPDEQFLTWGWRVPFLLGILLTGVGLFIRLRVLESPLFAAALNEKPPPRIPVLEAIRSHPRNVLLAMGARMAENAFFYFFTISSLSYAALCLKVDRQSVLDGVTIAAVFHLAATIGFGALSDRVGRRPVYFGGALFLAACACPVFRFVGAPLRSGYGLGYVLGMIGHAAMYGPQAAFLSELFGTRVRYSGASLGYQLAAPLAGGLVPIVATAFLNEPGSAVWPVALYLIGMAAITIVSVWLAAETHRHELGG